MLLQLKIHLLRVEGGKARRVDQVRSIRQAAQLHMTCCVAAASQLFGNLSDLRGELGRNAVEHAALAHAGVSRKGNRLSRDPAVQRVYAPVCALVRNTGNPARV